MSSRSFVRWLVCLPISSNKHTRTSEVGLKSLSVRACACGCERVRFQSVYIFSEQSIVYCGHLRIFRTYACKSINKLVRSILREKSTCVRKISATKFIVRCSTCVDIPWENESGLLGQHSSNCVNSRRGGNSDDDGSDRISHTLQGLMDFRFIFIMIRGLYRLL